MEGVTEKQAVSGVGEKGQEGSDGGQKTALKAERPRNFCVSKHEEKNKSNSERYPRTAGWDLHSGEAEAGTKAGVWESFNITDGQQSCAQLMAVQADETSPKRVLIYDSG